MSDDAKPAGGFSLRRWSARKRSATGAAPERAVDGLPGNRATQTPAAPGAPDAIAPAAPGYARESSVADAGLASPPAEAADLVLPPIDSLTPQSDFTPFMRPEVDPSLRSAALRKLFTDPHFSVMDGLDVYIDDYTKTAPIAPDIVAKLWQARYIFAPPPTRVNAQGAVEDVPEEELAALAKAQAAPPAIEQVEPVAGPAAATRPVKLTVPTVPEAIPGSDADEESTRQIRLPLDVPPEELS